MTDHGRCVLCQHEALSLTSILTSCLQRRREPVINPVAVASAVCSSFSEIRQRTTYFPPHIVQMLSPVAIGMLATLFWPDISQENAHS